LASDSQSFFGDNGVISGGAADGNTTISYFSGKYLAFKEGLTEQMRLTSTGLGIGTSSPGQKLVVSGSGAQRFDIIDTGGATGRISTASGTVFVGTTTNHPLSFFTNDAVKATLDSSGNLGLGVTPSAWSLGRVLQLQNGASLISYADSAYLNANAYFDGGWKYLGNAAASRYEMGAAHTWYTAASGTAGNAISFTQAMTLDASGRLGIGTTSPNRLLSLYATQPVFQITNVASGNTQGTIQYQVSGSTDFILDNQGSGTGGTIIFMQAGAERARITSGGYFKASNTGSYLAANSYHELRSDNNTYIAYTTNTNASPFGVVVEYSNAAPNGTGNRFLYCGDTGAERASIRSNGGLANYSANDVNLSDRREKTNFAPAKSYLDTICAIPVQTFNYIDQSEDDPGLTLGVVAQDVQAVAPELVMESNWGTEDNPKMRLSIYQTDLQYALMKCIQELKAQNDDLRARVAQLEAK
jgi:hypothetical protein